MPTVQIPDWAECLWMVTQALDLAGDVGYLVRCAHDPKTASAFLTLVGKVLPLQVTGEGGGPVALRVEFVKAVPDGH